ncbi:MAG: histidine phosphatase family protein, partial [Spirochaetales bacterium]
MTELLLILHGLTQWNVEKKGQGHIDTPLNATGRRMAELLAESLRNVPVTAIYSSDL